MIDPSPNELNNLCLSCGLCCNGAAFTHVALSQGDRDRLQQAGHKLAHAEDRISFPCQFLDGNRCSAYPERPRACRAYRCETLISVQAGEISLDEAHRKIASVVALNEKFIQAVPTGMDVPTARQLVVEDVLPPEMDQALYNAMRLAFVALQTGIDHHIRRAGTEVVSSMPAASDA